MRHWTPDAPATAPHQILAPMIDQLGLPRFEAALLALLHPVVPAASCSIYQTGERCAPRLFLSASHDIPDTTRACWQAYLSGPQRSDRTLSLPYSDLEHGTLLCHITAQEVPAEHRARVYEAHGVAERVSIVRQPSPGRVFAINFYRHHHQRAFTDRQIADFEALAPSLLALTQKHLALVGSGLDDAPLAQPTGTGAVTDPLAHWRQRLEALHGGLTPRELEVCARLLQGMTQEGIAADMGLALPTVKTYRNRAFARLGIHFRNELFARVLGPGRLH